MSSTLLESIPMVGDFRMTSGATRLAAPRNRQSYAALDDRRDHIRWQQRRQARDRVSAADRLAQELRSHADLITTTIWVEFTGTARGAFTVGWHESIVVRHADRRLTATRHESAREPLDPLAGDLRDQFEILVVVQHHKAGALSDGRNQ